MNAVAEIVKDAAYWTERHLETWAAMMREKDLPEGLPAVACGGLLENYTTLDTDNERAYSALDSVISEKVSATLLDMPPAQSSAIHTKYLYAVYRFPRGNFEDTLQRALWSVQAGLRIRNVWLGE